MDRQKTKKHSVLSNVGWRVVTRLPVFLSHWKAHLGFDRSPALQRERVHMPTTITQCRRLICLVSIYNVTCSILEVLLESTKI